jgi:lysozyme family protein
MIENWEKSFEHVIASEGGYVNDPHDHGGETNLGVTKAAWSEYLKRPIQDGEMKALTKSEVKPFYKSRYWDKCKCDLLPAGVDYMVFDLAVNGGVGRGAKMLQTVVGVNADGAIGPATLAALAAMKDEPKAIIHKMSQYKEAFYKAIVASKPDQGKFLKGWLNRVASVEKAAEQMIMA